MGTLGASPQVCACVFTVHVWCACRDMSEGCLLCVWRVCARVPCVCAPSMCLCKGSWEGASCFFMWLSLCYNNCSILQREVE